ncbi:hypothetical protein RhiirB3_480626 [Rhizophagus irregularis]|nr:hypothetical protein RhiirB3_480626 [Rhizophagus irregularis]
MSISSTSTIYNPNSPYENENFVDSQEVNFVKIDTNKIDKTDGGNKDNNGILERSHTTCTIKSRYSRYSRYQEKSVFDIQKEDDELEREEDYQISISQDGKFVITFDTANLRIKVYKNVDHRSFTAKKRNSQQNFEQRESWEENKPIAYFKINADYLTIEKFYDNNLDNNNGGSSNTRTKNIGKLKKDRWSFDISNMQNRNNDKIIFVAVSHIVDDDMRGPKKQNDCKLVKKGFKKENKINDNVKLNMSVAPDKVKDKKSTAIYCLMFIEDGNYSINKKYPVPCYFSNVSGISKFVQDLDNTNQNILKKFVLLNYSGIYDFKYDNNWINFSFNERFDYPKSVEIELGHLHKNNLSDCMNKLLTCLYNQYFLVEQYKNNVQALEVYNLAEMKLETMAKRVEKKDKHIRRYNKNTFSISKQKLQLCFTRGLQSIKLYFMENGLEIVSKKFNEIEKIYSLEFINNDEKLLIIGEDPEEKLKFIIWDLYNTGKVETTALDDFLTIEEFDIRLARTSGNLLQVNYKGKVTSVLKNIEEKLKRNESKETNNILRIYSKDENHRYFDKCIEPWVVDDDETHSYCLCDNDDETLQLVIGRSTVQIWHQIKDDSKCKDELPNKGEPFLEYIWTNGIPIDQVRKATRLRIKEFKYGLSNNVLNDFKLKVYWYERVQDGKIKENEEKIMMMEDIEIENGEAGKKMERMGRKEKTILRQDINDKVSAVRHACKALEHLNKRAKYLVNYVSKHRYEEMVAYINHIIWRFIKYKPNEYKLLDVRHNVMKNLILGDCDYLIKFILFGNNDDHKKEKFIIKHIPRSTLWKKHRSFIKEDDLNPFEKEDDKSNENDKIVPTNDMELAIYHCKGRELKDTITVAYLLEYYSQHARNNTGWMSTVSKALPLLYKYNYDDYARKLFRKECFAEQDHFSSQDPYDIIPEEHIVRCNRDTNFRAFRPIDKLQSDKDKFYKWILKLFKSFEIITFKFVENFDNDLGKPPIALRVVPLPEFTVNKIPRKRVENNLMKFIVNIFWMLLIPRWYKISRNEKNLLSPFSKVIRYENNDDMYDNPATEAVIDFLWRRARNFFLLLFLRYLIFSLCFCYVSWAYINYEVANEGFRNILVVSFAIFYYLAFYLLVTEMIQLCYHGPRKYFGAIFNIFDIISTVIPTIVMTGLYMNFQFADGFGSVTTLDTQNDFISSFEVRFILLNNPEHINPKVTSFSGQATNAQTDETFNVKLQSDFNPRDKNDNPFSYILTSIEAAYFWLNGNWVQRDTFSFWAVDVLSLFASIFFVTILQNMLIAFMGGVYEEAATKGRQALLRYRANQIADYEALHHIHFRHQEPNPRNIYYIGQSKNFVEWYKSRKNDQGEIYKDFEEKSTIIKHAFNETDYDKVSIWKFDDCSTTTTIEVAESPKEENSVSKNDQKVILNEINEMKKLRDNIDFIIDQLCNKFNLNNNNK